MKKQVILFIALTAIICNCMAQPAVSPNGKYYKAEGAAIYYEETGKGKPLLLLHGFGRTLEEWKAFIPELSKTNRVIAIDLPGHGRSAQMDTDSNYLHGKAAARLLAMIDGLKLDSPRIMGFSAGAVITMHIATTRPELAEKIILVAGQLYFSNATRNFISSLGGPDNFINDPKELSALHGPVKGKQIAQQFWNFRQLYGDPSFTPDQLSRIKAKTFIIHGDDDPVAPVSNAFEMHRHIRGSRLWVVPRGEHVEIFSAFNQPEFLKQVTRFLSADH